MPKLTGKVALVTGAGRGIGRAIALKLASEGARLVINDVDSAPANDTAAEISRLGGEAKVVAGSITAPEFAEQFVQTAIDGWGDLHIIINNAGYTWDNVIQKMTDDQFDAIIDVHLRAPFRILRAAAEPIRALSKREAASGKTIVRKVVNISSVAAAGNVGQSNYASAKSGVIGLTKTLAKEWGRYQVTVNCVAYGYIQTRLTQPLGAEQATVSVDGHSVAVGIRAERLESLDRAIPLGRGGTPEEAAGAAFLFCIPESDYVSGQVIVCGGGLGTVV